MPIRCDVVITGIGAVTALGVGTDAFWKRLCDGESGIQQLPWTCGAAELREHPEMTIGGMIADFDPKAYVRPRKALKVMCRELTTAYAAAQMAYEQGGIESFLASDEGDRHRVGTVFGSEMLYGSPEEMASAIQRCLDENGEVVEADFGEAAMREMYPLWMLRYLPNMAACHVGIAIEAFGHNNTIVQGDTSGLAALIESASVIQRDLVDTVLTGATGDRVSTTGLAYHRDRPYAKRLEPISASARPFHPEADGVVNAEGAASLSVESEAFCRRRGGTPLARLLGWAVRFIPSGRQRGSTRAIELAIQDALRSAGISADALGLVVSHAMGDPQQDLAERNALAALLPTTPVYAPMGALGYCGAGAGAVNAAISALIVANQTVPATFNAESLPVDFPLQVTRSTAANRLETVLCISHTAQGHAVAVVFGRV